MEGQEPLFVRLLLKILNVALLNVAAKTLVWYCKGLAYVTANQLHWSSVSFRAQFKKALAITITTLHTVWDLVIMAFTHMGVPRLLGQYQQPYTLTCH